jgi:type IV secretory pathway VirB2 component (pilin)
VFQIITGNIAFYITVVITIIPAIAISSSDEKTDRQINPYIMEGRKGK